MLAIKERGDGTGNFKLFRISSSLFFAIMQHLLERDSNNGSLCSCPVLMATTILVTQDIFLNGIVESKKKTKTK